MFRATETVLEMNPCNRLNETESAVLQSPVTFQIFLARGYDNFWLTTVFCAIDFCILYEFSIHIDTKSMGLPIPYVKESQVVISIFWYTVYMKIVFISLFVKLPI